jgi:hypothetical protein
VVVSDEARATALRGEVPRRDAVRGAGGVGQEARQARQRPLSDARRAEHRAKDPRGPSAHSGVEPLPE